MSIMKTWYIMTHKNTLFLFCLLFRFIPKGYGLMYEFKVCTLQSLNAYFSLFSWSMPCCDLSDTSLHIHVCACACHKFTHSHVEGTKSMLVALLHDDDGGGGGDLFISRNILFSLALHSANSPMRQWSHKRSLKTDVKSPLKSTPNRTSHLTADKVVIDFIFYRCLGGGEDSGPSWLLFWWFGAGLCCVFVTK